MPNLLAYPEIEEISVPRGAIVDYKQASDKLNNNAIDYMARKIYEHVDRIEAANNHNIKELAQYRIEMKINNE